jgi:tetratricopeptide (TPR) repeat protein
VEFLKNRSKTYYETKDYDQSAADLNKALEVNNEDPDVLYLLGLTYYADQKYKKCIKQLKEALKNKTYTD